MELKTGKITMKDLSIWFGLSPNTLNNNPKSKAKKLEILKSYAEYHFEDKNLIIDKVLMPEYSKAYETIEKEFPNRWGVIRDKETNQINPLLKKLQIDTCARVGQEIWYHCPQVKAQIKIQTAKNYTNKVKRKLYGRNYVEENGTLGYSERVWMNKEEDAPLSGKDLETLQECAKLAYADSSEIFAKIDDDYRNGELSKEEYEEAKGNVDTMSNYDLFVELVVQKLGYLPVKRTRLYKGAF